MAVIFNAPPFEDNLLSLLFVILFKKYKWTIAIHNSTDIDKLLCTNQHCILMRFDLHQDYVVSFEYVLVSGDVILISIWGLGWLYNLYTAEVQVQQHD